MSLRETPAVRPEFASPNRETNELKPDKSIGNSAFSSKFWKSPIRGDLRDSSLRFPDQLFLNFPLAKSSVPIRELIFVYVCSSSHPKDDCRSNSICYHSEFPVTDQIWHYNRAMPRVEQTFKFRTIAFADTFDHMAREDHPRKLYVLLDETPVDHNSFWRHC
jgi:hypothetical protein